MLAELQANVTAVTDTKILDMQQITVAYFYCITVARRKWDEGQISL